MWVEIQRRAGEILSRAKDLDANVIQQCLQQTLCNNSDFAGRFQILTSHFLSRISSLNGAFACSLAVLTTFNN